MRSAVASSMGDHPVPAMPLLSGQGALAALLAAIVLSWPMLATGGYLAYFDTIGYIDGGQKIVAMLADMLDLSSQADPTGGAGGDGVSDDAQAVRSPLYPFYTYVAGAAFWPAGFAILQAAMTLWMLFATIPARALDRPWVLATGFAALVLVTSLPWFSVYLMPDILAAAVLIHAALLMRIVDETGWWQFAALTGVATFAVATHYGNVPMAVALFGAVWLWRLVRGRMTLRVTVAAILPVLFAPLFNLTASTVTLDTPSVAPLRLPILLARSIQDGPARWYLQEACPEAPLAFCEAFGDDVPRNIPQFLWGEDGIKSLSRQQMARIRAEEDLILWRAFRAYPLAQTTSLVSNAARQVVKIGTGEILMAEADPEGGVMLTPDVPRAAMLVLDTFDRIVPWGTWLLAAPLLWLVITGRLSRRETEILVVVIAGLLLNAAIFGGLSAPVDRYQSRVVWLLPALAVIFVAASHERRANR